MWSQLFWKATLERMVRGAAIAIAGTYFVADGVFNSLEVSTWKDVLSLAIAGAFGSLVLSLGGYAVSGNGPAFNKTERIP